MSTIENLPDDPKYTIKSVSTQTGIRPVTLRAWERRHEVLSPHRSENRYRLYSDRDVAILRWLKNRIDSGVSISGAVVELRQMVRNGIWPDAMPNTVPLTQRRSPALSAEQYAHQLYLALIRHDEARADELLHEIQSSFEMIDVFGKILTPALTEIGDAWYRGEIRVTTEHFASSLIRGKLLTLFQSYPSRRASAYILVGCAPDEQHEIGSLMLSVLLRAEGYRIEYLGPDIPLEDLVDYASYEHPNMIILSASAEEPALEMASLQAKLSKLRAVPIFGYGGRIF